MGAFIGNNEPVFYVGNSEVSALYIGGTEI
jgi:hypothetical protein